MTNESYSIDEVSFAGFLCFLYGPERLCRIEFDERRRAVFSFDIPVTEAENLFSEWCAGTLVVENPKALWARQCHLGNTMREMNREGTTLWERGRSPEWWAAARAAGEQRRREREEYEQRRKQPIARRNRRA